MYILYKAVLQKPVCWNLQFQTKAIFADNFSIADNLDI